VDDGRSVSEALEQPLPGSCAGLERLEPARDAQVRDGDAGERLRGVRERADPDSGALEAAESGVCLRARPQIERRVVLGEALEQRRPVAEPLVEGFRRHRSVVGQVEGDSRTPRSVGEPGVPERPRVSEDGVEVKRERSHKAGLRPRRLAT
jgi:hypothetical protein